LYNISYFFNIYLKGKVYIQSSQLYNMTDKCALCGELIVVGGTRIRINDKEIMLCDKCKELLLGDNKLVIKRKLKSIKNSNRVHIKKSIDLSNASFEPREVIIILTGKEKTTSSSQPSP